METWLVFFILLYTSLCRVLVIVRKGFPWLSDCVSVSFQISVDQGHSGYSSKLQTTRAKTGPIEDLFYLIVIFKKND